MIPEAILRNFGAKRISYPAGTVIFSEGDTAGSYYEVAEGEVKMCNFNEDGKEFLQGLFSAGRSLGAPALFAGFPYPASAVATVDSILWRLPKEEFFELLAEHPEEHFKITKEFCERLHYKALMGREMSFEAPAHRIFVLLKHLKNEIYHLEDRDTYRVELTRQQIANLTGLRVETTIRAIKKLEQENALQIVNGKILL